MQDTRKDSMARMAGVFGVRYRRKQKQAFLKYMENYAGECGLCTEQISGEGGEKHAVHLLVGNLKNAERVVAIAYDTPSRVLFGESIYRPLDREKNFRSERREMACRTLTAVILLALYGYLVYGKFVSPVPGRALVWLVVSIAVIAVLFRLMSGVPNRYNFRRNTAGIVLLMELMKKRKMKGTAFLFLDRCAASCDGCRELPVDIVELLNSRKIILLDGIGYGGYLCLAGTRTALDRIDGREKTAFEKLSYLEIVLTEEKRANTLLYNFPEGVLLVQADEAGEEIRVLGTRTGRDDKVNFEQLTEIENYLANIR